MRLHLWPAVAVGILGAMVAGCANSSVNTTPAAAPTTTPAAASAAGAVAVAASTSLTLPSAGGVTPSFVTGAGVPAGETLAAAVATFGGVGTAGTNRRTAQATGTFANAVCGNSILLGVYGAYSEALSLTSALSQVNASVPSFYFTAFAGSTIYAELLDTNTTAPAPPLPSPPCAVAATWTVVQNVVGSVTATGVSASFSGTSLLKANELYYLAVSLGAPPPTPAPSTTPTAAPTATPSTTPTPAPTTGPTVAPTATPTPTAAPTGTPQGSAALDIGPTFNDWQIPALPNAGVAQGSSISAPGIGHTTSQSMTISDSAINWANLPAVPNKTGLLYITAVVSAGNAVTFGSGSGMTLDIIGTFATSTAYSATYTINGASAQTVTATGFTGSGATADLSIPTPFNNITLNPGDVLGIVITHST